MFEDIFSTQDVGVRVGFIWLRRAVVKMATNFWVPSKAGIF
jgi:hypothetical protein